MTKFKAARSTFLISITFRCFPKNFNINTRTFKINRFTWKCTSDRVKRVEINCQKKLPGLGIFPLQLPKHFWKQKILAKKVAKYALLDIKIAILTTPTKVSAESPVKRRWIANFLVFFRENASLGLFFGTRLNNLFGFAPKKISSFKPEKFYTK